MKSSKSYFRIKELHVVSNLWCCTGFTKLKVKVAQESKEWPVFSKLNCESHFYILCCGSLKRCQ